MRCLSDIGTTFAQTRSNDLDPRYFGNRLTLARQSSGSS